MTLELPVLVRVVRLARGACSRCGRRRVRFALRVDQDPDPSLLRSISGPPLCAECAGLRP